eukprot:m.32132 g.32132  ORF g.32132 m.32132 type:complete len:144 (-) comp14086_c0_seq1:124-555(-)
MGELLQLDLTNTDGDHNCSYKGTFNYGAGGKLEDSSATFTYSDGAKYVGGFLNSMKHGEGTMTYPSGAVYKGGWADGKFHGKGEYTLESGNKYVGDFAKDEMHGQGTYTWKNGNQYVGEFNNGVRKFDIVAVLVILCADVWTL